MHGVCTSETHIVDLCHTADLIAAISQQTRMIRFIGQLFRITWDYLDFKEINIANC